MPNVNIEDKLYGDIREYCKANKLTVSVFINNLLKKSFMVEKYDDAPPFFKKKEPEIISIPVDLKEKFNQNEFEELYLQKPEPVKRKEYIKPEVISVEEIKKKEAEPSAKEKAKRRVQYL